MSFAPAYTILGAGAWGTALAAHIATLSYPTRLYTRSAAQAQILNHTHRNPRALPGIVLPQNLIASACLEESVAGAQRLLVAIPAQEVAAFALSLKPFLPASVPLILCSKGIDAATGKTLSESVEQTLPENPVLVLSGPSFAQEVAQGLPVSLVLASPAFSYAKNLAQELCAPHFFCMPSEDRRAVELGGALKNIYAIGLGLLEGTCCGDNAKAALMTRSFAELCGLLRAEGAREETLYGVAVLGDLLLTGSSRQSRNFRYGCALSLGETFAPSTLTEGVKTAQIAATLCQKHPLEMPVLHTLLALLHQEIRVEEAIERLLSPIPLEPPLPH